MALERPKLLSPWDLLGVEAMIPQEGDMAGGPLPRSKARGWTPDFRTADSRTQKGGHGNTMPTS